MAQHGHGARQGLILRNTILWKSSGQDHLNRSTKSPVAAAWLEVERWSKKQSTRRCHRSPGC